MTSSLLSIKERVSVSHEVTIAQSASEGMSAYRTRSMPGSSPDVYCSWPIAVGKAICEWACSWFLRTSIASSQVEDIKHTL